MLGYLQGKTHKAPTTPNIYFADGRSEDDLELDPLEQTIEYDDENDREMMGIISSSNKKAKVRFNRSIDLLDLLI